MISFLYHQISREATVSVRKMRELGLSSVYEISQHYCISIMYFKSNEWNLYLKQNGDAIFIESHQTSKQVSFETKRHIVQMSFIRLILFSHCHTSGIFS